MLYISIDYKSFLSLNAAHAPFYPPGTKRNNMSSQPASKVLLATLARFHNVLLYHDCAFNLLQYFHICYGPFQISQTWGSLYFNEAVTFRCLKTIYLRIRIFLYRNLGGRIQLHSRHLASQRYRENSMSSRQPKLTNTPVGLSWEKLSTHFPLAPSSWNQQLL